MKMRYVVTTVSGRTYFGDFQDIPENIDVDEEAITPLNNMLGDESGSLNVPSVGGGAYLIPIRQIECLTVEKETETTA